MTCRSGIVFGKVCTPGFADGVCTRCLGACFCGVDCPGHRGREYPNQGPPAWQRRKKGGGEALGRSRGELSTKVHAVVDGLENSLRVLLTPGNRNDICYAQRLLEPFDLQGKNMIADKGYGQ